MQAKMKKEYIELPFKVFIEKCPDALELFPVEMRSMLLGDPAYIVRLSEDGTLEVGYIEDKWAIA